MFYNKPNNFRKKLEKVQHKTYLAITGKKSNEELDLRSPLTNRQ